jgi:hypothetical protein
MSADGRGSKTNADLKAKGGWGDLVVLVVLFLSVIIRAYPWSVLLSLALLESKYSDEVSLLWFCPGSSC